MTYGQVGACFGVYSIPPVVVPAVACLLAGLLLLPGLLLAARTCARSAACGLVTCLR